MTRDDLDMYSPHEPPSRTGTIRGILGGLVILAIVAAALVAAALIGGAP